MSQFGGIQTKEGRKPPMFLDYRRSNFATLADTYRLPRHYDCMDSLREASVFTTIEDNCGNLQKPISGRVRDKTYFTTHGGTYRYKRTPFGLGNVLA